MTGLTYDAVRLLRLPLGPGRWKDAAFDLLFYACAGAIAALALFYANGGAIRLYALCSIALGALAYARTVGFFTKRWRACVAKRATRKAHCVTRDEKSQK